MKTAFDNVPIHIPGGYMFTFGPYTYANADNVSGHPLDRVCREVEQLVKEWPDRLTMASTGGPVTGNDESRSPLAGSPIHASWKLPASWASNTHSPARKAAMAPKAISSHRTRR